MTLYGVAWLSVILKARVSAGAPPGYTFGTPWVDARDRPQRSSFSPGEGHPMYLEIRIVLCNGTEKKFDFKSLGGSRARRFPPIFGGKTVVESGHHLCKLTPE